MGAKLNHYPLPVFIPSEPTFMINKVVMREYKVINVLVICPKLKILNFMAVWNFVNTGANGAGNIKVLNPCLMYNKVWLRSDKNCRRGLAVIREYKVINVLMICQKLKILWHFEMLTWESMGNPKMFNILKAAVRRAKQMKIWVSWY